jgi:acetoin utilization deacetylase AcuC-like enzyme
MKLFYSPKYQIDIGPHVFPTVKYQLIHDRLIKEGIAKEKDFIDPGMARDEDILLVHTKEYVEKLKTGNFSISEIFKMELPYKKEHMEPSWICANGTIKACQEALKNGIGIHIGGGFHHAFPDHGEGFCIVNDIAIGIKRCLEDKDIKKAMVIDCDLHQGNGTAAIFKNNPNVFTFSIHEQDIYPYPKQKSDLDIGLEAGVGDEQYVASLKSRVLSLLKEFKPQLIVYLAGADPYKDDQLGFLELSIEGLKKRDELVIGEARKQNIALVTVFGGGYAREVEDTVTIHSNTIKTALKYCG